MAKWNIFGVPITVDFSGEVVDTYDRYQELCEATEPVVDDSDLYESDPEKWDQLAKERIALYYEMREPENDDDDEPRSFWSRLFG